MSDTLLLIIGVVGLAVLFGAVLFLQERGEKDQGHHKKCPRCHERMPRTSWQCSHCGWTEEFDEVEVPPIDRRYRNAR